MENKKAITVMLTDRQAEQLKEIRKNYDVRTIHNELDRMFINTLQAMLDANDSDSNDLDDAADNFRLLSSTKQLVKILLQPGTDV